MKLMHLGDLHLGKYLLEQSLIEDQKYIIDELIEIVKDKSVDCVMICGDIYDKSIPNIDSVNLFSIFLSRLYKLGVKVLIISGNHDSADRLAFGNELFIDNGIFIESVFNGNLRKVILDDDYGVVNIYMLPFIKPSNVRKYYSNSIIDSYQDAVSCVIENTNIDSNDRNIIMVHQFVTSSGIDIIKSDSEALSLGGIDNIDVSLFDKFDYVAMGHIHGGQKLIRDTVRYSGSPLKYSFSEVNQRKSVPIIEVNSKGDINIELVPLKPLRDMRVIEGKLDEIISNNDKSDDYISVILTDDDYVIDAIGKLRRVYKNVLKIEYKNNRTVDNDEYYNSLGEISEKSMIELFEEFYQMQNNILLDDKRKSIVESLIKEIEE